MQGFLILVLAVWGWSLNPAPEPAEPISKEAMTVYYFIRHAEKDVSDPKARDPELTAEGLKRAEKWAEVFDEVPFEMIYSTDYHRTKQTAAPVAKDKGLEVQSYDPSKPNGEAFRQATKGRTVLIVGHSNTNPSFVNSILGEAKYQDLDESEYGSLFIVTLAPSGELSSQLLFLN